MSYGVFLATITSVYYTSKCVCTAFIAFDEVHSNCCNIINIHADFLFLCWSRFIRAGLNLLTFNSNFLLLFVPKNFENKLYLWQ